MLKKQKHIVYCSYDGLLDSLGKSQILPYVEGLNTNSQYQFTIISFEKIHNQNEIEKLKAFLASKNINWIPLVYTKDPPILSTIWDILKLNMAILNILKNKKIDLLHCRSYLTSTVALNFKNKYKIPFIFDMRGFWADERVDGKLWNKNKFPFNKIYRFFKKKEIEFLQQADYTISLTENGKKEIESWKLPNQSHIKVIPCCTDKELFKVENVSNKREELGINKDDFILSYVGSIGTWYMLDEMLDFFVELKKVKKNSKFLFITKDNPILIYEKAENKKIKSNCIIIQSSAREMMPSFIAISNFSIFFILPVFSKKASSPTKMGEIMNLGIPIICNNKVGDVEEIMNKCMPELIIKEFSKKEYSRVVNLINKNYKIDYDKVINFSNNYYSLEKGIKTYDSIYEQILNK